MPSPDLGFYVNKTQFSIAPKSELVFEMFWKPSVPGSWRDEIVFRDQKARKGAVILVFETINDIVSNFS
jgi:hypothetical protein